MTAQALLNFNGVNGSQSFIDDTGNQLWVVDTGTPVLDTSNIKWGSASLKLTSNKDAIGSSLLNPLTGDFTIESWFYADSYVVYSNKTMLMFTDIKCSLQFDPTMNLIQLYSPYIGFLINVNIGPVVVGNWFHVALVRKNGDLLLLFNGIIRYLYSGFTETITDVVIGVNKQVISGSPVYDSAWEGNVDGLKISDIALYETSTIAMLNNEPDLNQTIYQVGHDLTHIISVITDKIYHIPFNGRDLPNYTVFTNGDSTNGGGVITDPTSTNMITGNVTKLGLPFELKIVAVSVEFNPQILGHTISDPNTGDYSIDVYPWSGDVLLYAVQDYGLQFNPSSSITVGQIIHPTLPNKNIYVAQNSGALGSTEPTWPDAGNVSSGEVLLSPEPLYRPLMNGFIKPIITPI